MENSSEYSEATEGLEQFGVILCGLIKELLENADIQIHSIDYRVKDVKSAHKKLSLLSESHSNPADLTDLLGVRIITYFPDDVDRVATVVEKEFKIDHVNSVDKRKLMETDKFGYLSLHYVASMNLKRARLVEYKRYDGMRFELQIRSILQHAWVEIEHDLGYKLEGALPKKMRRSFSRLAGLLEIADQEFERLRQEISRYEEKIDQTIKSAPQTLLIDQSTIVAAVEREKSLIELDRVIAQAAGTTLKKNVDSTYAASEATELKKLGLKDIGELLEYAEKYKKHIALFAKKWFARPPKKKEVSPFNRSIGLFYLNYAIAAQREDNEIKGWGRRIKGRDRGLMLEVRKTWQEVVKELGPAPRIHRK